MFFLKIAGQIQTRVLWCQMRLLCQLCHNRCAVNSLSTLERLKARQNFKVLQIASSIMRNVKHHI